MLLEQLVTFARVVDVGSFTRAAELLSLSQPSVTRQVALLEREFGVPLIERAGRKLVVTPAGQTVHDHAKNAAALIERARSDVAALADPELGQVAVASATTVGLSTLPTLLSSFRERYPYVQFRLWSGRTDGVLDRLLTGRADLGLVSAMVAHRRLDCIPLFDDPVVLVAAPDVAQAISQPVVLEQFPTLKMILYQSPSRFRTLVDAAFDAAGAHPTVAMEFDSHEAVRSAALAGWGVAIMPLEGVQTEIAEGRLERLLVHGLPPINRTICLVRRRGAQLAPAVHNFLRLVVERYSSERSSPRNSATASPPTVNLSGEHSRR